MRVLLGVLGALALVLLALGASGKARFVMGGALINAGYALQDSLHAYDFEHEQDITAAQVWEELQLQNALAASVRGRFSRTVTHPVVALLVCMDARIDTNELVGDTRRNYYVVRTAGSVMSAEEEDMLELAVANGVKVIVVTRHTDCAAEKAAADAAKRAQYPALTTAVDERQQRLTEFLARPAVASRIASGELLVKQMLIETPTEQLVEGARPGAP